MSIIAEEAKQAKHEKRRGDSLTSRQEGSAWGLIPARGVSQQSMSEILEVEVQEKRAMEDMQMAKELDARAAAAKKKENKENKEKKEKEAKRKNEKGKEGSGKERKNEKSSKSNAKKGGHGDSKDGSGKTKSTTRPAGKASRTSVSKKNAKDFGAGENGGRKDGSKLIENSVLK